MIVVTELHTRVSNVRFALLGSLTEKWFPRSSSRRNILTLASGSALAQCIVLLGLPFLSRFYEPNHFGGLAVIAALGSLLGMAATLRYDMAIVLPKNQQDAASLFVLAGSATLAVSILSLLLGMLFHDHFLELLGLTDYPWLNYAVPPAVLCVASYFLFEHVMVRRKEFWFISVAKLARSGATIMIQIGIVLLFTSGPGGLVWGYFLGFAVAALILAVCGKKIYGQQAFSGVDNKRIRKVASKYRKFPLFSMPNGFINGLSRELPNLMLASLYSPWVLGLYYIGFRAFSSPMGLITQSTGKVFYQRVSQEHNACRPLVPLIVKLYGHLFFLVLPPTVLLFFLAEPAFSLVFGDEWTEAGRYLKYLLPYLATMFIISPSTYVFNVLNKQEISLVYDILLLGLRYGALVLGTAWFKDPAYTVGLYSLMGFFANITLGSVILILATRADGQMNATKVHEMARGSI